MGDQPRPNTTDSDKVILWLIAIGVIGAVLAFPPADRVIPGRPSYRIGTYEGGGMPEARRSEGFTFIGNIGGPVVIRYPQWIIQLVVTGAVVLVVLALMSSKHRAG